MGDLGKIIVAKGFKKSPKVQKLPNLVTLVVITAAAAATMRKLSEIKSLVIFSNLSNSGDYFEKR